MTDAADRIARLREKCADVTYPTLTSDDVLALCDDYETLAARCTLTDEETEAVRRQIKWTDDGVDEVEAPLLAVLRRLLGEGD